MGQAAAYYRREKGIGIITLNRPQRLNAINNQLLREMMDCLNQAGQDREAAVVILVGEGRAFCAGQDLKETSAGLSIQEYLEEADRLQEVERLILKLGKPLHRPRSGVMPWAEGASSPCPAISASPPRTRCSGFPRPEWG